MPEQKAIHFLLNGRVQGVGFRYFTQLQARRIGLCGWVRNRQDGKVEGQAQGTPESITAFEQSLRQGPRHGQVDQLDIESCDVDPSWVAFEIRF